VTVGIFRGERLGVAEVNILGRNHAWPFGAGAEEPAALSDDTRDVEGIAGDEELHALTGAEVGADHGESVGAALTLVAVPSG
jgi:hypothetical protein